MLISCVRACLFVFVRMCVRVHPTPPLPLPSLYVCAGVVFLRKEKVKKLPHLELYVGDRGRLESFVCGPSKSAVLKEKLDKLIANPKDPSLGDAPIPDPESFAAVPPEQATL